MKITLVTKNSPEEYLNYIPEKYSDNEMLLGVACLDDSGDLLGVAVIEPGDEKIKLLWIYVLPEYRECGVGRLLMKGVNDMARAAGAKTIEAFLIAEKVPTEKIPNWRGI